MKPIESFVKQLKWPDDYIGKIINADCLDVMREMPDKSVDLILTDPPYGLNRKIHDGGTWSTKDKFNACLDWDFLVTENYWQEIKRISKNQIIWGGQYYNFPPSRCWLVWKKPYFPTMSDAELAWTSFDKNVKVFEESRNPEGFKDHPTQKPLSLIKWCVNNYSNEGDLILDPFLGSGTTAIACRELNRKFIGIEKEPKYVEMARERLRIFDMQPKLL